MIRLRYVILRLLHSPLQSSSCFTRRVAAVLTRGIGCTGGIACRDDMVDTAAGRAPPPPGRSSASTGSGTDGRRRAPADPWGGAPDRWAWTPLRLPLQGSMTGSWMDWTACAAEMEPMVERWDTLLPWVPANMVAVAATFSW